MAELWHFQAAANNPAHTTGLPNHVYPCCQQLAVVGLCFFGHWGTSLSTLGACVLALVCRVGLTLVVLQFTGLDSR